MPTKAPADSAQVARKSAVIDDITHRLQPRMLRCSPSTAGSRSPISRPCVPALRPRRPTTRSTRTPSPAGRADAGFTEMAELLEGPVAIAFVRPEGDAVTAAKALRDFAKTNPNLVVKGGMLGPRLLSVADVEALADVPPRDVLLARLAGGFQAPLVKAAGLFQAFTRNFAWIEGPHRHPRPTVRKLPRQPRARRQESDSPSTSADRTVEDRRSRGASAFQTTARRDQNQSDTSPANEENGEAN